MRACADALFPPTETARIVRALPDNALDAYIVPRVTARWLAFLPYAEPAVRALVHEAKFRHNTRALALLAQTLAHAWTPPSGALILPVPLSRARMKARGHNQVHSLLTRTCDYWRRAPSIDTHILHRTKDTPAQTSVQRSRRQRNVYQAFSVADNARIAGTSLILFDDVVTTGATLAAAQAALAPHRPASITCVALAY